MKGEHQGGRSWPTSPAAQTAHGFSRSKVAEELIGETARVRERDEMATWTLVDGNLEALMCDATLELDRKDRSSRPAIT